MDINLLMDRGIRDLIDKAGKYSRRTNGRSFFRYFGPNIVKKTAVRKLWKRKDMQVPPFLIASISASCNLNCSGCYARLENGCMDINSDSEMTVEQWDSIFSEADKLGVSFILLAGGEPGMRRDVIEKAGEHSDIVFPVFTNGTAGDDDMIDIYRRNENLVPIISIEGDEKATDTRRGEGVSAMIKGFADRLREENIMFGVSITVTKENYTEVSSSEFVRNLHDYGCGAVVYVEYVPSDDDSHHLVLDEKELENFDGITSGLKAEYDDMIIISFPGDEDMMGGCLAAGRGFFHISPDGSAEPCPFSPYSKLNLRDSTITDVLKSDYFKNLRKITAEKHEHYGGCTLYNERESVQRLLTGL